MCEQFQGGRWGNVAHSNEANPRPKCVHFAPAQQSGLGGEGMQLCQCGRRREGGFATPFATVHDTKNPAAHRKFLPKLPALNC